MSQVSGARSDSVTRWLLRCGAAAGPVFVAAFLVEGATRPGYKPLRHPVSSLALGKHGWTQATNFAVTGALYAAGAAGLSRAAGGGARLAGAAAAGATAAGLLGAAAFTTDPVSGYPPGTPDALERPSREGTAHNLMSTGVFLGLPAGALAVAAGAVRNGRTGWGLYSAGTAVAVVATTGAFGAGFGQSPRLVGVAGLIQRISITIGFGWLTALAGRSLRELGAGRGRAVRSR
ncbi:MAG TPA: DUF998 domain-containing protein [Streptosporangiaceae bacterium]